jgi:1-acyl-sn-glycerol-3-phosphate acyltransferase
MALLPFHGNLIQAAISAAAPVQPVALSFLDACNRTVSRAPCYVNEDTLLSSVWRTVAGSAITAVVRFGEPQGSQGRGRREWAEDLRSAVEALRQPA